ncbi:MAG TPA: N-acetylmuramoyl-L-alanine amidase [Myxococcota bacterium]|nr:N-acetylmuramoyl-L-alanine amidase [Myxococcota bacterium]
MRGARLALLALAAPALLGAAERPAGLGDVKRVQHWSYPGFTRVVVETTRPVHTRVERLPADRASRRPERLYLDLDGLWVGTRFDAPIEVGDGLLRAVRVGQNTLRRTRVVIDLERYDRHRLLHLSSPARVVIDVFGHRPAGSPAPRDRPDPGGPRLASELRPIRTVVVDPGHGGRDTGAQRGGVVEKDVTLRIARALRPLLEAEGLRVVLTRETDRTRTLEERTALAEGVGGDLFLSLHVNAAPGRELHGIETYYLDKSHERHSLRVAATENGVASSALDPLQRTLATLRTSETSEQSAALAVAVHRELVRGLRVRYEGVADLGVKSGPFYVLFLASMPSVLIETGFLTNPAEARRLATGAYAELVAARIARGVVRYRDTRGTLVATHRP